MTDSKITHGPIPAALQKTSEQREAARWAVRAFVPSALFEILDRIGAAPMRRENSLTVWDATITPPVAAELLRVFNVHEAQRSLSKIQGHAFVDAINDDLWDSATVIEFDETGLLLDGQHRLWAISQSKAVRVILVVGKKRLDEAGRVNERVRAANEHLAFTTGIRVSKRTQALFTLLRSNDRLPNWQHAKITAADLEKLTKEPFFGNLEIAADARVRARLDPMSMRAAYFFGLMAGEKPAEMRQAWLEWLDGTCDDSVKPLRDRALEGEAVLGHERELRDNLISDPVQCIVQAVWLRLLHRRTGRFQALKRPEWKTTLRE